MKYSKRFYENQEQGQSQVQGQESQGQESQGQGDPTVDKLADTFKSIDNEKINMKVSEFVEKFKKIASDDKVQEILKSGKTDGSPDDEQLTYSEGNISVTSLLPTQSEIGFDQSVKNILTDEYGSLKSILDGNADVGGPIVIYNSRYIIDGHHRWSQVYAANPKAKMVALNIIGNLKPTEVLKAVHVAIALKVGKVPSSNPEGINILRVSFNDLKKKMDESVNEFLTDEKVVKIWSDYFENKAQDQTKGQGEGDVKSKVSNHIWKNLRNLIENNKPIDNAPGRKHMPQTDAGDSSSKDKLDLLDQGIVNFIDPKPEDVKESRIIKTYEKFIQNWKKK